MPRLTTYVLHNADGLFSRRDELVLSLLDLLLSLGAQLLRGVRVVVARGPGQLPGVAPGAGLDRIEGETSLLDVLARAGREHQVGVQGGVPASQKPALDLGILGEAGLANTLAGQGILLQGGRERILARAGVLLVQKLRAGQTRARQGVVKRLGLRLSGWGCDQGSLGFGGGSGAGEKVHLLANGAAEILEGLLDIGRIVVGLVGVLRAIQSKVETPSTSASCVVA